MKKLIVFALFALALFPTFLQAQRKAEGPHKHKKNPEMRTEMRQYFENQMYPVLSAEHKAFDAKLPASELVFLQAKRAEAKQLQQEKKALHRDIRTSIEAGNSKEAARAANSTKIEALRGRKKALAASLKPFIEKNKSLIDQTVEKLKPQQEKWQAERKAIRAKYMPEQAEKGKAHGKGNENNKGHGNHKRKATHDKNHKMIRFLLWDGEMNMSKTKVEGKSRLNKEKALQLNAFPNPAINELNVQFDLTESAEKVTVKIRDMKGALLQETVLGKMESGLHSIPVKVSDFNQGQYIYTVEIDGKVFSRNFTKQ